MPTGKPQTQIASVIAAVILVLMARDVVAGPHIEVGDLALRHDIQRLADFGVVAGPVSTWPLAWGPILDDISRFEIDASLPRDIEDALFRVRARGQWETQTASIRLKARISAAENPASIRSFQNTPREDGELSAGATWTGDRLSIDLNVTGVSDPIDSDEIRADGSQFAFALGNVTIAASTLDRWWGPAWDSNLVLSGNARPIPALTVDRRFTRPFESKWLSWIGPWDTSFVWGVLEEERVVPDAQFMAFRFNFRPLKSLEIGVTRAAQWCGKGRPCDVDTFWNLLLGKDNRGGDGIDLDNEPGNQTAALDFRWSVQSFAYPVALYGQFMAEDEAGGFPSRYLGQLGIDGSGVLSARWSYRWYAEAAATSCDFWKSDEIFNCGYNHGIYKSGYRYKGRTIGHAADNDARIATLGFVMVDALENSWQGIVRGGKLNRAGPPDAANSLTELPRDVFSAELIHNRVFRYGRFEVGLGYDQFGRNLTLPSSNDFRAFIQWRSDR